MPEKPGERYRAYFKERLSPEGIMEALRNYAERQETIMREAEAGNYDTAINEALGWLPAPMAITAPQALRQMSKVPGWRKGLLSKKDQLNKIKNYLRFLRDEAPDVLDDISGIRDIDEVANMIDEGWVGLTLSDSITGRAKPGAFPMSVYLRKLRRYGNVLDDARVSTPVHELEHVRLAKQPKDFFKIGTEYKMHEALSGGKSAEKLTELLGVTMSSGDEIAAEAGSILVRGASTPEEKAFLQIVKDSYPDVWKYLNKPHGLLHRGKEAHGVGRFLHKHSLKAAKKMAGVSDLIRPEEARLFNQLGIDDATQKFSMVAQDRLRGAVASGDKAGIQRAIHELVHAATEEPEPEKYYQLLYKTLEEAYHAKP